MKSPIQQNLEYFYLKKGEYNEEIPLLVINKFLSYNNPEICSKVDSYIFNTNNDILKQKLFLEILKCSIPFIPFSKKTENKEEFKFLFKKIKHFYQMSENEFKLVKDIFMNKFKDKEKLLYYFRFFGIEKKNYKKYDLQFETKKKTLFEY